MSKIRVRYAPSPTGHLHIEMLVLRYLIICMHVTMAATSLSVLKTQI